MFSLIFWIWQPQSDESGRGYIASWVAIWYSTAAARVLRVYMVLIYKITDVCTIFKKYGYGNHHLVMHIRSIILDSKISMACNSYV